MYIPIIPINSTIWLFDKALKLGVSSGWVSHIPGEICLPGARLTAEGHDSCAAGKTSQDVWTEDSKPGKGFEK